MPVEILPSNLSEIRSPFSSSLNTVHAGLTSTERQVAQLVKQGRQTKEIVAPIDISARTVESHRMRIRKKLGLTTYRVNLETFLVSVYDPYFV